MMKANELFKILGELEQVSSIAKAGHFGIHTSYHEGMNEEEIANLFTSISTMLEPIKSKLYNVYEKLDWSEDDKEVSEETEEPKKEIHVLVQIEEMGFKKGVHTFVKVEEWADTDVVWNNDKLKQGNEVIDGDVFKCFEVENNQVEEEEKVWVLVRKGNGFISKEVTRSELEEIKKKQKNPFFNQGRVA